MSNLKVWSAILALKLKTHMWKQAQIMNITIYVVWIIPQCKDLK